MLMGLINEGKVVSAPSTTTWNSGDKSAAITLSNLSLTATSSSGAYAGVRAVASHSTGKFYYESHVDQATAQWLIGIGNASATIASFAGSDNNAIAVNADGNVYTNGSSVGTVANFVTGNTVSVAVDMGNKLIWIRVGSGNWNNNASGDPTNSSTGAGISFSAMAAGPWFPIFTTTSVSDAITANFNTETATQSVPSGYGNW